MTECAKACMWQYQKSRQMRDVCNKERGHVGWHRSRYGLEWTWPKQYRFRQVAWRNHAKENADMVRPRVQTTLRVLRERSGLSQVDLARIISRGQPEISMWEWGKETMPDQVRQQITGALRAVLPTLEATMLRPEDLDQPWDDVVQSWRGERVNPPV